MKKTILVCDFCQQEKELKKYDSFEVCKVCDEIYFQAKIEARKYIEAQIDFSVKNVENLLYLIKQNDSEKYWGTGGPGSFREMREEIIKTLEAIKKKND